MLEQPSIGDAKFMSGKFRQNKGGNRNDGPFKRSQDWDQNSGALASGVVMVIACVCFISKVGGEIYQLLHGKNGRKNRYRF